MRNGTNLDHNKNVSMYGCDYVCLAFSHKKEETKRGHITAPFFSPVYYSNTHRPGPYYHTEGSRTRRSRRH